MGETRAGRPGTETPATELEGVRDPRPLRPAARRANPQRSLFLAPRPRLSQVRGEAKSPQRTVRVSGPLGPKLPRPHPPSRARSFPHLDSEGRMEKLWRGVGTHPRARATPTRQERSAVPDGRQRPAAGMRRWLRSSGGGRSPGARSPRSAPGPTPLRSAFAARLAELSSLRSSGGRG